ncbi:LamG-like jellyroll fold domain-containing protein [Planktothrix sp. FACHB-1365]|uniref:LamG-like jellyroll fold domain-containing protein n=1 Tax=Planktothrix sp. FACHB-1365 TaxID=2692855 RepID=UPI00168824CD|nr:LamG-like jellyroll fold domain-containing protein [Planktothrix sp. FACHB-1365]MBD2483425.1 ricin-type beta-trefoil lectin domain protein [Planktothrix sp. FACHB-1365]
MDNQYVLSFDGKDDYVSIPTMNVDYSQGFTVEAWVLYHSFENSERVIDFGNGQDSNNIVFHTKGTARKLYLVVAHNSVQQGIESEEVLETEVEVWIHVAATIDKSGNATLYKNGQVVKTGRVNLPLNVNRSLNYIAKSNWGSSFFHGCMTELRVWNIARSAAEIQASKNSRLNGDEKGLVQYWPLNEISGDTVVNLTSNGHDGTVHGATLVEAKPQLQLQPATPKPIENLESVLKFDGPDDYVSIPTMNVDYSQGFTVEAWVLYHSFQPNARVIDFGIGHTNNNIVFHNRPTPKTLSLVVITNNNAEYALNSEEILETGVWIHVAATIDKSGNATLYKNGQVVKTGRVNLPLNVNRTTNYIAKSNWGESYFHGCMTEVRVWNIARSAAEIQAYQNSRLNGDEKGLAQYWPLNEISGDTVVNLTSNGHDGTVHGATLVEAKPQLQLQPATPKPIENLESVLKFDGPDDYVSIPTMNVDYSQGFTVEAWVLYHSFQPNARVIDFGIGHTNNNIVFHNRPTPKTLSLVVITNNNAEYALNSEEILETGVWIHVAATIDKSGNATLYKNGQVVKTGRVNLPLNVNRTTNYIAKSNWGESYFHGCMTEVRVWNIARSAAEIQAYQNSRLNGDEKGLAQYWPLNEISGDTVVNLSSNSHHGTVHGATLVSAKPQLQLTRKTFLIKSKLNGLAVVGTPHSQVTTGAVDSQNPLQRWTITADGVIKNEAGFVLDYQGDTPPYYVVIAKRIQGTQGSPSQQWRIENGVIKNKHKADLVVDIAGSNPEPNTKILAAPAMDGLNQKWEIVSV